MTARDALQAREEAAMQMETRRIEDGRDRAMQEAADAADDREERIESDFRKRMAAAATGRDSELGRLRLEWAGCETRRLSENAAAAAAPAEEDRLRRASAASIVRAAELSQSERDECIDRYEAISEPLKSES
ncbi:hypothetical protein [Pseudomonas sp. Hp2]|uniref:hypothetical protein n=1 Tax=Pseudomonas sp. Hp2 TaxID=701189 RepID=UPI00112A3AFD|nr:hypothetical protein [Pseudomonas sp. Hp2]